jgi:diaminopimelate decarboxylase
MKPMGPIPAGFAANAHGELLIGGHSAVALADEAMDTPLFVYDAAMLRARVAALRAAMPDGLAIHYAMKANPYHPLLMLMAELTDGIDIASGGELTMAQEAGARHISFAGPGKRDRELAKAIAAGITINLESESEAARALAIADELGRTPKLAVRVNPDFDLKGSGMRMGGGAKPFGIDAERVPALVKSLIAAGTDWRGFHIFAGSQALDSDAIAETQAQTVALAGSLADAVGATPPLVNLGGGFGVPYFPKDVPVDIGSVGQRLGETLEARVPRVASPSNSGAGWWQKRAFICAAWSIAKSAMVRPIWLPMADCIINWRHRVISGLWCAAITRLRSQTGSQAKRQNVSAW